VPRQPRRAPFKIPRELRIRGRRWLVIRDHELSTVAAAPSDKNHKTRLRKDWDGLTVREDKEIYIARHSDGWSAAETFVHELLHACVVYSDHKAPPLDDAAEERFIQHVQKHLLDALSQLHWRSHPRKRPRRPALTKRKTKR